MRMRNSPNAPETASQNFVDRTNWMNYFNRSLNDRTTWQPRGPMPAPDQVPIRPNSLNGFPPPAPPTIPWNQLTPYERSLVHYFNLYPEDIQLMRATGTNAGQLIHGKQLYPVQDR